MVKLGINVDHVATLRQARRELDPNPILAAKVCEEAGANSIVAHLREDRRHIQDADIRALKRVLNIPFNLEMSLSPEIIRIAARIRPEQVTLVPEKRQELTTEGGLDVYRNFQRIKHAIDILEERGILISLFIDPIKRHIKKAQETGATIVELHTGRYALAKTKQAQTREYKKICQAAHYAASIGLSVSAGHGLTYTNTRRIAKIKYIEELNIGHSIISKAVFIGLKNATKEMLDIIK